MAPASSDTQLHNRQQPSEVQKEQQMDVLDGVGTKTRLPRWTKQETFALIQGKKAAENRDPKACRSPAAMGQDQTESKWESVSSYCKQRGVNRGPIQCRKRWSNMVSDYRKIKAWEFQRGEAESFWNMRNELKRERKLPGFFDREVYDVLDGREFAIDAIPLAQVTAMMETNNSDGDEAAAYEEEEDEFDEAETVFDVRRHVKAEAGLFSDSLQNEIGWNSVKETMQTKNPTKTPAGVLEGKRPSSTTSSGFMSPDGWKRRRVSSNGCDNTNVRERLIEVLERNGDMLNAQLEAQNKNWELDREQRKEHNDSLVGVLNKFVDVLDKIANKM